MRDFGQAVQNTSAPRHREVWLPTDEALAAWLGKSGAADTPDPGSSDDDDGVDDDDHVPPVVDPAAALKAFLLRWLGLHGILFTRIGCGLQCCDSVVILAAWSPCPTQPIPPSPT